MGQVSGVVSEMKVAALQVNRDRIMNPGANSRGLEIPPQIIALLSKHRKDVVNRLAIRRFFKETQPCVSMLSSLNFRMLPESQIPIVQMS